VTGIEEYLTSQPVLTSKQSEVLVRLKAQAEKLKGACGAQMCSPSFTPGRLRQASCLLENSYSYES
jgi:hypothetical protein